MTIRDRTLAGVVVLALAQGLNGCGAGGPSLTPSAPPPVAAPSSGAGVNGVVFRNTPTGRVPLEGATVTLVVQVQTGPFSGSTYPVYGHHTNGSGEFHFDSPPNGARLFAYATYSGTSNPCMTSIANFQGSANVEIDLYPDSESEEWIVNSALAGPGPIVTGTATAEGVAASDGYVYFEAVYETFTATSPIDSFGRYALCGVPVSLMFPSRVWVENGRVSCDASGGQASFHSIQPHSSSDYFSRNYDLHHCNW